MAIYRGHRFCGVISFHSMYTKQLIATTNISRHCGVVYLINRLTSAYRPLSASAAAATNADPISSPNRNPIPCFSLLLHEQYALRYRK